jgi:hypothetical protein
MDNRRIEQLEKKIAVLEKQVSYYEGKLGLDDNGANVSVNGFLSFKKMLEQHIDWLDKFKLTADIVEGKKNDNATFERTDAMFRALPENILAFEKLKEQLKIKFDPEEGKPKMTATSPQSLGAVMEKK